MSLAERRCACDFHAHVLYRKSDFMHTCHIPGPAIVHIKVGSVPTESTGFVTKAIQIITLAILPRTRGYEWISLTLSRFAQQRKATIKGMPKIKHR